MYGGPWTAIALQVYKENYVLVSKRKIEQITFAKGTVNDCSQRFEADTKGIQVIVSIKSWLIDMIEMP